MAPKYQYFDGLKFTRDDKSGYYLNSTIHERMHRYVWKYYNGPIPKGYVIHHKDGDKSNNDISNLMLLPAGTHTRHHGSLYAKTHYDRMIQNLEENARPAANEWHRSAEGRTWHKQHYEKTKDAMYHRERLECAFCGALFEGIKGKDRFCSNKCKSAYRRKTGVDNVKRICIICGNEFETSKYRSAKCCSQGCANRYRTIKTNEQSE